MQLQLVLAFSAVLMPAIISLAAVGRLLSRRLIAAALLLSTLCSIALVVTQALGWPRSTTEQLFQVDQLSGLMLVLISSISLITLTYSFTFLDGDTYKSRFIGQIALLATVMSVLVISGNVVLLTACWCLTTPLLAVLTRHAKTPASLAASARLTAHHRISDALLLTAMLILMKLFASCDIAYICSNISTNQASPVWLNIAAVLIVTAAMIKSSVFPFHSWLFGTLEAPTTFSAFLHAGLINIAGFITLRLAPVIFSSGFAPYLFICLGLVSALIGAICSLVQPDVKRKLVFSTIAQMGFMCLQCGLGAFSSALFHLICHGYFKCYLFLDAGSSITAAKSREFQIGSKGSSYAAALAVVSLLSVLFFYRSTTPISLVSALIFGISLIYECTRMKSNHAVALSDLGFRFLLPALIFLAVYAGASTEFSAYFTSVTESPMVASVLVSFCTVMMVAWIAINAKSRTNLKDWLYILALNGGYLTRD